MKTTDVNVDDLATLLANKLGHGMAEKCGSLAQVVCDYVDSLNAGPKQGDTVWVRNFEHLEWKPAKYIAFFAVSEKNVVVCEHCLGWFDYMTTTDPYALKYELTAQDALVAVGQGKVVENKSGIRIKWDSIDGIVMQCLRKGQHWKTCRFDDPELMYAIVEA